MSRRKSQEFAIALNFSTPPKTKIQDLHSEPLLHKENIPTKETLQPTTTTQQTNRQPPTNQPHITNPPTTCPTAN